MEKNDTNIKASAARGVATPHEEKANVSQDHRFL
jgi:hypothetical protein